jgi:hypothetical protein
MSRPAWCLSDQSDFGRARRPCPAIPLDDLLPSPSTDRCLEVLFIQVNTTTTSGVFPAQAHKFAIRFADTLQTLCCPRSDVRKPENKGIND